MSELSSAGSYLVRSAAQFRYKTGMPPVMNRRDSRERAARAAFMRHVLRLPWSAVRDELGFSSVGAAQLAVKSHEQRNPPRTPDGARRSANETLDLFLSGIVGQFIRATNCGDDETAAMLADKGRALVAEQAKLNAAYIPQPTAEQNLNVTVSASPLTAVESWRREMLERAPDRPVLPVLDVEPEPIAEADG